MSVTIALLDWLSADIFTDPGVVLARGVHAGLYVANAARARITNAAASAPLKSEKLGSNDSVTHMSCRWRGDRNPDLTRRSDPRSSRAEYGSHFDMHGDEFWLRIRCANRVRDVCARES